MSLGGDSVGHGYTHFAPKTTESWVQNAVSSITRMVQEFHLDGIDIDYEHFKSSPEVFVDCIGQLITHLKKERTISFTLIAPYADDPVQAHYLALWKKYGHLIDYVNFQFYAYDQIGMLIVLGVFQPAGK